MISRWLPLYSIDYTIASTYAQGKGFLFEMFFGWRQTNIRNECRMVFSRRDWKKIDEMISFYHTFAD